MTCNNEFKLCISKEYFPVGTRLIVPNGRLSNKIQVVKEPKLSFWNWIKKLFRLNYKYVYTVKLVEDV